MANSITKKQHYVPRFYLKEFTDTNGFLHIYDRIKETFYKSRPDEVFRENYLYEVEWKGVSPTWSNDKYVCINEVEKILASKEGLYSALTKKIVSICDDEKNTNALILKNEDKITLKSFIVNMFVRNPVIYDDFHKWSLDDKVLNNERLEALKFIVEKFGMGDFKSIASFSAQKASIDESLGYGHAFDMLRELDGTFFTIMKAKDRNFITSSLPVLKSIENNFSYFVMPLTSKYLIMFTDDKKIYSKRNKIIEIEKDRVYEYNRHFLNVFPEYIRCIVAKDECEIKSLLEKTGLK